jgi:hypothetical protein
MYFKGIITGLLLAVYFQLFRISNGWVNDAWYMPFVLWILLIALSTLLLSRSQD